MNPLLDSHLHTAHPPLIDPPKGWRLISCAAGPADWGVLVKSADEGITPFLGIHPQSPPGDRTNEVLARLEGLLASRPYEGVGEVGLDRRFYPAFPRREQEALLRAQLELAEKYRRPVALHQVRAPGALAEVLEDLKLSVPLMVHGFTGSEETADRFLRLGAHLSFGPGPHWKTKAFTQMFRRIPRDRILLESDWPYAAGIKEVYPSIPAPAVYRSLMENHYRTAAGALGIDTAEFITIVLRNGTVFTH